MFSASSNPTVASNTTKLSSSQLSSPGLCGKDLCQRPSVKVMITKQGEGIPPAGLEIPCKPLASQKVMPFAAFITLSRVKVSGLYTAEPAPKIQK